jgi:hypothetical protein
MDTAMLYGTLSFAVWSGTRMILWWEWGLKRGEREALEQEVERRFEREIMDHEHDLEAAMATNAHSSEVEKLRGAEVQIGEDRARTSIRARRVQAFEGQDERFQVLGE